VEIQLAIVPPANRRQHRSLGLWTSVLCSQTDRDGYHPTTYESLGTQGKKSLAEGQLAIGSRNKIMDRTFGALQPTPEPLAIF
jgi:hypothetical protein